MNPVLDNKKTERAYATSHMDGRFLCHLTCAGPSFMSVRNKLAQSSPILEAVNLASTLVKMLTFNLSFTSNESNGNEILI